MEKIIDGMHASSYKLGAEVMIKDKIYKPVVDNGGVVWEEIEKCDEEISEEILDEFNPKSFTFFLVGNENKCRMCADAIRDIELYGETSEESITYKKWEYDNDTKNVIGKIKQAWIRRAKQNNEKFRNFSTIPQIWYKGEFLGGFKELRQLLEDISLEMD